MKHLFLLLFPLVMIMFPLHAQDYYWSKGEKRYLQVDQSSLSVFFQQPVEIDRLGTRAASHLDMRPVDRTASSNWVTLNAGGTRSDMTPQEAARAMGLNVSMVKSLDFARIDDNGERLWLTPNVVFAPSSSFSPAAFAQILEGFSGSVIRKTGGGIEYVEAGSIADVLPLANAMYESGMFHFAEPSFRHKGQHNSPRGIEGVQGCNPADPIFSEQMVLDNNGSTSGIASWNYPFWAPNVKGTDINVTDAWCITTGNSSTIVAVFDEGVEAHKDLEDGLGNSRVLPGYNTDPAYSTSGGPVNFSENHGMGVAGLIAASHDGVGVVGIAPEVQILPVHAFDYVFDDLQRADGIMWAYKNGADVIVNAWTYQTCAGSSAILEAAIDSAHTYGRGGLGSLVIFSSGFVDPGMPTCVQFPANLPGVLTVGAIGTNRGTPNYVPYGPELDLVGVSSVDSNSSFVATIDREIGGYNHSGTPAAFLEYTDTAYTRYFGGTSTTSGEAAGVAALVLAINPSFTYAQLQSVLINSAQTFGGTLSNPSLYGAGALDAHAAVLEAQTFVFPVTWDYFNGVAEDQTVRLAWGTHTETNTDRFEVQRELNGEFQPIGSVKAAGNSGSPSAYEFVDLNPSSGVNVYRLRQIDLDGQTSYSAAVEVAIGSGSQISAPYPNPVDGDQLSVDLFFPKDTRLLIRLTDLTGRTVREETVRQSREQAQSTQLDVADLPAGMYLLSVSTNEQLLKASPVIIR